MLLNILLEWDKAVFEWINSDMSNVVFDFYMPVLRDKYTWVPIYVFIIGYVAFNLRQQAWKVLLITFVVVGLADFSSSQLIKKSFKRQRPCNTEEVMIVPRISCGSGYSFTSSHAANHFALSVFLILAIARRKKVIIALLLIWAFLVSFSQVYVGLHFPSDIMAGGILGSLLALLGYKMYSKWVRPG